MPAPTSDEVLVTHVQADGLDQLVPLSERYQGPLFGFLCRLNGGDLELSQDPERVLPGA